MGQPSILFPNTPYLSVATATATDSYAGTLPAYVLSAREDTYWRPATTNGSKVLTIDLGEVRTLDSIGIVGEGMDGVALTVATSPDNNDYTTQIDADNLSAPVNCGWGAWSAVSARYVRLTFLSFGSTFRVAFVCLCDRGTFPYLESDFDPANIDEAGEATISPGGLYLGHTQRRSMREISVNFGTISAVDMIAMGAWVNQCIKTGRPWVFIPDTEGVTAYFCWQDKPKFSAPYRLGMYDVGAVRAMTRAV